MNQIWLRLLVVVATVALGWILVVMAERRQGSARSGLTPGITLVAGEACRLCDAALAALDRGGVVARVLPADHPEAKQLGVRSLPTLIVVDGDGQLVLRRSGKAAVVEAARVEAAA